MHRLPRALRLRQQNVASPRLNRLSQKRLQSQYAYRPNGDPVRFQAVRFRKPGFTLRRIATTGLYIGAFYAYLNIIWRYLDIEVEVLDGTEEQKHEATAENGEDGDSEYAEEDSLFIPMTWATKQPRTFYRGSDPEWQEFIKIAKDKSRYRKIQDELVQIVYRGSQQNPGISRQLGTDAKIGKYWLDISFPDGPPQEYERSGLEFGDGYIAWSQQRITPENQYRLMRALWPKAAFDSLWATTKVLAGINYRRMKQALGWEEKDPLSPEERYRHAMEMMQKRQQAGDPKELGKAQMDPDGNSGAVVGASGNTEAQPPRPLPGDSKRLPWQIQVPLPPTSATSNRTDIPIAMLVFRSTLTKQWNPKKMEPPRGTFVVQGMVEVKGGRGRILFDVQSCYDPKTGEYVVVNAGVRNVKRWNQAPKGGP